jgi:hypothetical protein
MTLLPGVGAAAQCVVSASWIYQGEAVQVELMKPKLKAPGTKRLKLKYDNLLSSIAFKFNLRHYIKGWIGDRVMVRP